MKILRQETGDRRQETGDRRQETGDRRQETGNEIRLCEAFYATWQRFEALQNVQQITSLRW